MFTLPFSAVRPSYAVPFSGMRSRHHCQVVLQMTTNTSVFSRCYTFPRYRIYPTRTRSKALSLVGVYPMSIPMQYRSSTVVSSGIIRLPPHPTPRAFRSCSTICSTEGTGARYNSVSADAAVCLICGRTCCMSSHCCMDQSFGSNRRGEYNMRTREYVEPPRLCISDG